MAGSSGGATSGGKKKARIEIIPLIDVIFFLLATFVLFTLSLNKSNGINVQLPSSSSSVPRDTAGTHTISVTSDGSIAWDKDTIALAEFLARLQQFHNESPEGRILINGDERALFAQAIYVFDESRKAGFTKVYIETKVQKQTD
jgi:biopolymer transport protein ExbD